MTNVDVQVVPGRRLAVVRRRVEIGSVGTAWGPALDKVWAFLRARPGLRTDGHNVFPYHHPTGTDAAMEVEFGVEVIRVFHAAGEVVPADTPAGEVATAVHRGGYDRLRRTHDAIHAWRARTGRTFAGISWEVYGDWSDDPSRLETTVFYLLSERPPVRRRIVGARTSVVIDRTIGHQRDRSLACAAYPDVDQRERAHHIGPFAD
ncbi:MULTISPECIES: GyrI-like domain-containing protein [unclassified Pseudofrankia]|uniref:GyrI-like domain-containing protein n=1 Tax=unclassified Pseudofrankia TaxID=2994372 RepID=UPI0008DA9859|nr:MULTISPECIES: GyrI-like domain-containing protein [unclassified Pseudofrankia]MDT3443071.1 GyrI-like domain-containing protein [Pseudofrankia sp. BMG5.37]OHV49939.1 hypothetical protein BCD48_11265 [Pseudofrankia sp. BMG5.36]